ncbi:hypothetical protein CN596_11165 [Bacillus toyonensis]|uniref:Uncharacterized protein n=1 Tax=Bacillus toyonensis TaxID=155322 RepID=A0AB36SN98_9BACI|nr:hypothetical protein [Bacillus toyonensis]MCU4969236.1 hypothetical protein [Bacillus toyonensis]PEN55132.1 hypothetical protein CN596_11165 [Bacillus toyonensis]PHC13776.1 hypothetical protein COF03_25845 [Bacillus toyonensis]PHD96595.1 hypothetical protein COF43_22315 [Bacillus toyonensis]
MNFYPYEYYPNYNEVYIVNRPTGHHHINPGALQLNPGGLQPQYPTYPPYPTPFPPYPTPPSGGGCMNKWATFRLKDGRTMQMYVTFIGSKSVAGSVFVPGSGWKQVALDLDEILESQC